jgi:hypothetical protein
MLACDVSKVVVLVFGITSIVFGSIVSQNKWPGDLYKIADEIETYFLPGEWTFTMSWIITFLFSGVFVTCYATLDEHSHVRTTTGQVLKRGRNNNNNDNNRHRPGRACRLLGPYITLHFLLQTLWFVSFGERFFWTSLNIIWVMYKLLDAAHEKIHPLRDADLANLKRVKWTNRMYISLFQFVSTHVLIGYLLAWFSFLACLNATVTLVRAGIAPSEDWSISWLVVLFSWGTKHVYQHQDLVYTLVTAIICASISGQYFYTNVGPTAMLSAFLFPAMWLFSVAAPDEFRRVVSQPKYEDDDYDDDEYNEEIAEATS